MTHRPLRLAVIVALSVSACGPDIPLEVGIKGQSTDVVYGRQSKPAPPPSPVPAANPAPGFPGFIVPPPPRFAPDAAVPPSPPAVVAEPCPPDDPFKFPVEPASGSVAQAIQAGVYSFRQIGSAVLGDRPPVALPTESRRQVRSVATDPASGEITYDVAIESLGETTTTSYAVRRTTGDSSLDGIFLTRVVTRRADGSTDEFTPVSGVRLIALPAGPGASWDDVGTDALRATSMVVQGNVVGKGRVNACGTPLDAWTVEVSGRLLGPGKDLTVTATYQIGTQFGGLVLADDVHITGTEAGTMVDQRTRATINRIEPDPLPDPEAGR